MSNMDVAWWHPPEEKRHDQQPIQADPDQWMKQFEEHLLLTVQNLQRLHAAFHSRMP